MKIVFTNDKPIYVQVAEMIKVKILKGDYAIGSKIPSIRELAVEFTINPNTMQKVLQELEDIGVIHTERTSGKFIVDDEKIIEQLKQEYALTETKLYLEKMQKINLTKQDCIDYIERNK